MGAASVRAIKPSLAPLTSGPAPWAKAPEGNSVRAAISVAAVAVAGLDWELRCFDALQVQHERRPFAHLRLHSNANAQQSGDSLHDRKSQAIPFARAVSCDAYLKELIEYMSQLVLGNAYAGVLDFDAQTGCGSYRSQRD